MSSTEAQKETIAVLTATIQDLIAIIDREQEQKNELRERLRNMNKLILGLGPQVDERKHYVVEVKMHIPPADAMTSIIELGFLDAQPAGRIVGKSYIRFRSSPEHVELVRQQPWAEKVWQDVPMIPAAKN